MQSPQQIDFVVAPQSCRKGSTAKISEDIARNSDHLPILAWIACGRQQETSARVVRRNFRRPLTGWAPRDRADFQGKEEEWWR
eukprot:14116163-Alexandrium_andersonii.AAC.1